MLSDGVGCKTWLQPMPYIDLTPCRTWPSATHGGGWLQVLACSQVLQLTPCRNPTYVVGDRGLPVWPPSLASMRPEDPIPKSPFLQPQPSCALVISW